MDKIIRKSTQIVVVLFIFAVALTPAFGDVIYVDIDRPGGDGSSWEQAYNSLQDALGDAEYDDSIWVAAGTYKPDIAGGARTTTFNLVNGVKVYGGFPTGGGDWPSRDFLANVTTLSGDLNGDDGTLGNSENSYHVISGTGIDPNTVVDGFTITAGNANGSAPNNGGGGMYNNINSSPTVANCIFTGNAAVVAGGIYNYSYCSPAISDCTFNLNSGSMYAGGIYLYSYCDATITDCTFTTNTAGTHGGGALSIGLQSSPKVLNCIFTGNSANFGGAIQQYNNCDTLVANCIFNGNTATSGGAMFNHYYNNPSVINCTFVGNTADDAGAIWHTQYPDMNSTITNCIIWGNSDTAGHPQIYDDASGTLTVTYSDVEGGWVDTGNLDTDPLFQDAGSADFHLQNDSNCINAGDNSAVPAEITTDLDGAARIQNDVVDMGAYEHTVEEVIQYRLGWFTSDGGGGTSSGGDYIATVTIGQGDSDWAYGGDYEFMGGFMPGGPISIVDTDDFARFAMYWLQSGSNLPADIYKDGIIDGKDLREFVSRWLNERPYGWSLR